MNERIRNADELMGARAEATGYARLNGASEAEISRLSNRYQEAKAEYTRLCLEANVPVYGTYNA